MAKDIQLTDPLRTQTSFKSFRCMARNPSLQINIQLYHQTYYRTDGYGSKFITNKYVQKQGSWPLSLPTRVLCLHGEILDLQDKLSVLKTYYMKKNIDFPNKPYVFDTYCISDDILMSKSNWNLHSAQCHYVLLPRHFENAFHRNYFLFQLNCKWW